MRWEQPELVEIGMNAEIGGYQSDFDGTDAPGPRRPTGESSDDKTGTRSGS